MGLQRRRKRIPFGLSEGVLAFLLFLTALLGFLWGLHAPQVHWQECSAQIVGLRQTADTKGQERLHVTFKYKVDGRVYSGDKSLEGVSKRVYQMLPEGARRLLQERGIFTMGDLPEEIRTVLQRKSIQSLDKIPQETMDALAAQGYTSIADAPASMRNALLKEDYGAIAAELEQMLPDLPKQDSSKQAAEATTLSSSSLSVAAQSQVVPVGGFPLKIRYNPVNPYEYNCSLWFSSNSSLLFLGFFILALTLTLLYSFLLYPQIKST